MAPKSTKTTRSRTTGSTKRENSNTKKKTKNKTQTRKRTGTTKRQPKIPLVQQATDGNLGNFIDIEQGVHTPSMYVVCLKPSFSSPSELHETDAVPRTNLLQRQPSAQPHQDDLILCPRDVESQLIEDLLPTLGSRVLPSASAIPLPSDSLLPSPPFTSWHGALRTDTKSHVHCTSRIFLPPKPPENIFDYFDFPEDERLIKEEDQNTQARFNRGSTRAIAAFVALSFLFVLPLHAMNVAQDVRATKAVLEFKAPAAATLLASAAEFATARSMETAKSNFLAANNQFALAQDTLKRIGSGTELLLSILPATQAPYRSGTALLKAGEHLSIAGSRLSDGYTAFYKESTASPIARLDILEVYLSSSTSHLEQAALALEEVQEDAIPVAYKDTFKNLRDSIIPLITTIRAFEDLYPLAKALLGSTGAKRYLVIFQNNTEIRPTGGFIGSFAEIKIRDGIIEEFHVPKGGSYDLQGSLTEDLRSPEPLQLLSARWEFQDANWFPDFPTSSRQLMQFYQQAGGGNVDGVIAVNATLVAQLIGLLGPMEMEKYGRTIDEENFLFETQKIVENEYDLTTNAPKAFIVDLASKLLDRTTNITTDELFSSLEWLDQGLANKDIQIYVQDETLEREIIERGWGGEMKWTQGDYLMVIDTNLGGGKTDGVITQTIDLDIDIADNGTLTNTLTISRTHNGIQGLFFSGVNNVDYLRVYVPKGSTLLQATGFRIPDASLFETPQEDWTLDDDLAYSLMSTMMDAASGTIISEEQGKTVFGNWVQTAPGTTSTVTFRYTLPFTIDGLKAQAGAMARITSLLGWPSTASYTLFVQKQSGILDRTMHVRVHVPEAFKTVWSSRTNQEETISNETDASFQALFERL